jgi:hypothetical protein
LGRVFKRIDILTFFKKACESNAGRKEWGSGFAWPEHKGPGAAPWGQVPGTRTRLQALVDRTKGVISQVRKKGRGSVNEA